MMMDTPKRTETKRAVYTWRLSERELEKLIALRDIYGAKSLNEALQIHLTQLDLV
jgi:hypothetical protein